MAKYKIGKYIGILAFVFNLIYMPPAIAVTDSTQVLPFQANSYTYATVMVTFQLSSPIGVAYCPTGNQMQINFLICPSNAVASSGYIPTPSDTRTSLCNRQIVTPASGIMLMPWQTKGVALVGLRCTVPIGTWIPSSVLTNIGTANTVAANVLGYSVYINYQRGTIPYVQPTTSQTYFNLISGNWGSISDASDNAPFLRQLLPNGFNNVTVQFQTCSQPPPGGSWCS